MLFYVNHWSVLCYIVYNITQWTSLRENVPTNVRIQRGGQGARTNPVKNHKNIVFSSNTGLDPLKNCSYEASIQCWAIIGTPAKR